MFNYLISGWQVFSGKGNGHRATGIPLSDEKSRKILDDAGIKQQSEIATLPKTNSSPLKIRPHR